MERDTPTLRRSAQARQLKTMVPETDQELGTQRKTFQQPSPLPKHKVTVQKLKADSNHSNDKTKT